MPRGSTHPRSNVFFPWERRRGVVGFVLRARFRLALVFVLVVTLLVVIVRREARAARVRATRATIGDVVRAVATYRAGSSGKCPAALDELVRAGLLLDTPTDAWDRPLRLVCPGRKDPKGFEVVSDGPDGEPYGLDRIE